MRLYDCSILRVSLQRSADCLETQRDQEDYSILNFPEGTEDEGSKAHHIGLSSLQRRQRILLLRTEHWNWIFEISKPFTLKRIKRNQTHSKRRGFSAGNEITVIRRTEGEEVCAKTSPFKECVIEATLCTPKNDQLTFNHLYNRKWP